MKIASASAAPFTLTLEGIPDEACSVHRWAYRAELDEPYELTIVLHVPRLLAPLFGQPAAARLNSPAGLSACFSLQTAPGLWEPVHGRIARVCCGADELSEDAADSSLDIVPCTLTLRPRLWWASLNQHSRSLQRTSVKDAVLQVLGASLKLTAADLDFRLSVPPARRRYRQQYQESDLAFVSRLLEREGWTYFFEQSPEREIMVVTDDPAGYPRPAAWSGLRVLADTGLASASQEGWQHVVTHFERCFQTVTTEHRVDDLNYRSASTNLQAEVATPNAALGQHHSYGNHSKTVDEAQWRAQHQSERTAQHAIRASARSSLNPLAPGSCIGITQGPRRAMSRWLILSVQAQGSRTEPYANQFTAQPETVPYRPEWDTPLPDMAGFTHMRLDTTNTANPYARLDQHGRYLGWHYFEHQNGQDGLGSAPIRLARDYAGPNYGQHFPVHAGVEALAGYVHGDPDRPVLLGVMHDSRNPNHVNASNPSRHVLRTWANNKLRLEDQPGQEHIKLSTDYGLSQLNLGHLVNQDKKQRGQGFELRTENEGALRAQKGWLLSTHATDARGDPKAEGQQLHNQPLQDHVAAIRPWADNRSKAATQVGLEAAISLKAADQLQKNIQGHKTPIEAMASPAGIAFTARQDLILGAEREQGFYSQSAITLSSSEPFGLTAKKGLRIHAESGGLKQVVSEGDYTIHVQDGDFELLAKDDIQLESKTGVVRLQTKGGNYFVEFGPGGIRSNAKETHMLAAAKVDITGGPVSGRMATDAGFVKGLDYFGGMTVKDDVHASQQMLVLSPLHGEGPNLTAKHYEAKAQKSTSVRNGLDVRLDQKDVPQQHAVVGDSGEWGLHLLGDGRPGQDKE